jgi:1-acyl-sn-glycerol-3-phosphate acyltransferase
VSLLSRVFPPLWDDDRDRLWDLMRAFVSPITLALAPSYAYGVERLPQEGGVLVAANHFSGIDHPLIGAFSPRPLYFMAKAELFEIPVIGEILGWTNTFPIRRGEADREGVRRARELVREGKAVVVHIEGTRQPFGHPGSIQRGALLIALAERVPVVPCAVDTFGWSPLNRRRCAVVFGEPLSFEGLPRGRAGYDQAGRAVEAAIVSSWRQAVGAVRDGFPERLADGARRSRLFPRQGRRANLPH